MHFTVFKMATDDDEMAMANSSDDSDEELQRAFASGDLKVGLNKPSGFVPRGKREFYNNVDGLKQKLEQISQSLDWIERMDVTCKAIDDSDDETTVASSKDTTVHDDFKRELKFYKQAQAAVAIAIPKLHELSIPTQRPEDYFAEMVKTDDHMQRVRSKLLSKQHAIERSAKMKKLREMKKFGKKVQQEVLGKRQKEKREMLEAVKKYRKGKQSAPDFMKDDDFNINAVKDKPQNKQKQQSGASHKRKGKDKKFGFGGKKRNIKRNTQSSTSDVSSFSSSKHSKPPRNNKSGANRKKQQRPGKSRRKNMKR